MSERWRDDYIKADEERALAGRLGMSTQLGSYADAYHQTVLDLIDKHAREGQ